MAAYARIIIDIEADARLIDGEKELACADAVNDLAEQIEWFIAEQARLAMLTATVRTE